MGTETVMGMGMGTGTGAGRPAETVGVVRNGSVERLIPWAELARLGLRPQLLGEGAAAVPAVAEAELALVILPIAEPAREAVLCAGLRAATSAPVLGVAADVDRQAVAELWDHGLDDVHILPMPPLEFRRRLEVLLQRAASARAAAPADVDITTFDALQIDYGAREVHRSGEPTDLTKIEFDILAVLSRAPRVVISRTQLIEAVWDGSWYGDDHMIDVHIGNLRRKLGESGRAQGFIKTVRGIGHKFDSRHAGAGEQLSLLPPTDVAPTPAPVSPEAQAVGGATLPGTPGDAGLAAPRRVDTWAAEAAAPGAVDVVFGVDYRLIAVVGQHDELLGWELGDLIGCPFAPVRQSSAERSVEDVRQRVRSMHEDGVEEWLARVPAVRRDGTPTMLLARSRAVFDDNGDVYCVRAILREAEPAQAPVVPTETPGRALDLTTRGTAANPGLMLNSA